MSTETKSRKYELKARADRQAETRQRIVEATAELHEEVGPARTTVAEIARRAGVQRVTVYKHFPDELELFGACSGHYLSQHPLPEIEDVFSLPDPAERLRVALERFYGWFRNNQAMTENVHRDRLTMPALDQLVATTSDAAVEQLVAGLTEGFGASGADAERLRVRIRLAFDFWTWRRLSIEGLDDKAAAALMTEATAPT
jgi:AcrR family transcriptional regulator